MATMVSSLSIGTTEHHNVLGKALQDYLRNNFWEQPIILKTRDHQIILRQEPGGEMSIDIQPLTIQSECVV